MTEAALAQLGRQNPGMVNDPAAGTWGIRACEERGPPPRLGTATGPARLRPGRGGGCGHLMGGRAEVVASSAQAQDCRDIPTLLRVLMAAPIASLCSI